MESAFGWLKEIMHALICIFPRRVIVRTTEGGVKFKHGRAVEVRPGTCWYWPMFTEVYTSEVVLQTLDLPNQCYLTADHKVIAISGTILYKIPDPLTAFTTVHDLDASILNVARYAIVEALRGRTLEEIHEGRDAIDKDMRKRVAESVSGWGVKIMAARLTDLAPCRAIRLIGDGWAVQSAEV